MKEPDQIIITREIKAIPIIHDLSRFTHNVLDLMNALSDNDDLYPAFENALDCIGFFEAEKISSGFFISAYDDTKISTPKMIQTLIDGEAEAKNSWSGIRSLN